MKEGEVVMSKKYFILFIFLFLGLSLFTESQEIDPFYLRLLNKGETLFKAGNYRDALKELRIAVFGIEGNNEILGKAHVYMGLSYYYLDQKEESESHLRKALDLIGTEGISEIELSTKKKDELSQILAYFGVVNLEPKAEAGPPQPAEDKPKTKDVLKNKINDLEKTIKENSKKIEAYYQLYNVYIENKQTKKARKTLEKLTKQEPLESKALNLLGILHFKERNFKKAEYYFSRISSISKGRKVPPDILDSSRAYHILSLYYRGKKDQAYELAEQVSSLLPIDKISTLNMNERDKIVLSEILSKE
jgi:tetratricopeptide (TPR) repeat protein